MKLPRFWIDYIHKTFSCQSSHFFQCFLVFFPELTGSGLELIFEKWLAKVFQFQSYHPKMEGTLNLGAERVQRGTGSLPSWVLRWRPDKFPPFYPSIFFLQNSWVVKIIWNLASVLLYGHAFTIILSINTNKHSNWVPKLIEKEYVLILDFKSWQQSGFLSHQNSMN